MIQVEDTSVVAPAADGSKRIAIHKAAKAGQDIRPVGSDIKGGTLVMEARERIGVAEVRRVAVHANVPLLITG